MNYIFGIILLLIASPVTRDMPDIGGFLVLAAIAFIGVIEMSK